MSGVVLYHHGNRSFDPKSGSYFDPWDSYIWDSLDQLRIWNPKISVSFIVDGEFPLDRAKFSDRGITLIETRSLKISRDLSPISDYFVGDSNPLWRTSLLRFFYIEQAMKDFCMEDVFTFDNDVLVYTDLQSLLPSISSMYSQIAMTRIDRNALICSMVWIRNASSIRMLNDALMNLLVKPHNRKYNECRLLDLVYRENVTNLIGELPIWFYGPHSVGVEKMGGVFDPATIGQYLGGCHNGSPKGHIMMHHEVGSRLREVTEGSHRILRKRDELGRGYYAFVFSNGDPDVKLHSLHIHAKKMKEFMSNV